MSGRVTRKRARLEAEQEEEHSTQDAQPLDETEGLVRDDEFWYKDGTVYLTTGKVAFKIYYGPLVDHSPVFKDMLSLPQPPSVPSALPHPVINVTDSPCDLKYFLRALMPSKTLQLFKAPLPPVHALSAWVRLGHKYQVEDLVEQALGHLRKIYPSTFEAYQKRRRVGMPFAIHVIELVSLVGALDLLPVAFADICQLGRDVTKGYELGDGSIATLATSDLALCMQSQRQLAQACAQASLALFNIGPHDSCQAKRCKTSIHDFRERIASGEVPGLCSPSVFSSWIPSLQTQVPMICLPCKNMLKAREEELLRGVFERLPALVGVTKDGWGALTAGRGA